MESLSTIDLNHGLFGVEQNSEEVSKDLFEVFDFVVGQEVSGPAGEGNINGTIWFWKSLET